MHFDKFPTLSTYQCRKTSFKTEVYSCSGYPSEALRWIQEVEMVDSVDDLKTSQSIRGDRFLNFRDAGCEDRFIPEEDHPELQLQDKNRSGRAKGSIG